MLIPSGGGESNQTDVAHLRNSRSSGVSQKRRPAKIIADHPCVAAYHLLAFNKTKRSFVGLIEAGCGIGRKAARGENGAVSFSRDGRAYNPGVSIGKRGRGHVLVTD